MVCIESLIVSQRPEGMVNDAPVFCFSSDNNNRLRFTFVLAEEFEDSSAMLNYFFSNRWRQFLETSLKQINTIMPYIFLLFSIYWTITFQEFKFSITCKIIGSFLGFSSNGRTVHDHKINLNKIV